MPGYMYATPTFLIEVPCLVTHAYTTALNTLKIKATSYTELRICTGGLVLVDGFL